jgi:hypothetical protein
MKNKELLLNKHKDKTEPLYPIITGGNVIAQEVDEDNRLLYIVELESGERDVLFAEDVKIIQIVQKREPVIIKRKVDLLDLLEKRRKSTESSPKK